MGQGELGVSSMETGPGEAFGAASMETGQGRDFDASSMGGPGGGTSLRLRCVCSGLGSGLGGDSGGAPPIQTC